MAEEIDKYEEDVDRIIDTGKEKGYLTYGEVNDLLPGDITSPDELDDLMTTINTQGIDVLSTRRPPRRKAEPRGRPRTSPAKSPTTSSSTSRPARSKRPTTPSACTCARWAPFPCSPAKAKSKSPSASSAARLRVMKAISRSPIVIREIVGLGEDLKRGVRNIKEVVTFDEEELTEEILAARVKATVARIDELVKHQKKAADYFAKSNDPQGKDAKAKHKLRAQEPLAAWAARMSSSPASSAS